MGGITSELNCVLLTFYSCLFVGQVLVSCSGSLGPGAYTSLQFDNYVLKPVEDGYQTLDGKVNIIFAASVQMPW